MAFGRAAYRWRQAVCEVTCGLRAFLLTRYFALRARRIPLDRERCQGSSRRRHSWPGAQPTAVAEQRGNQAPATPGDDLGRLSTALCWPRATSHDQSNIHGQRPGRVAPYVLLPFAEHLRLTPSLSCVIEQRKMQVLSDTRRTSNLQHQCLATGLTSQQKVCQITLACMKRRDSLHAQRAEGGRGPAQEILRSGAWTRRFAAGGQKASFATKSATRASKGVASAGRSISRALELASVDIPQSPTVAMPTA